MRAKPLKHRWESGHRRVLTVLPLLVLRDRIPTIPAPRGDRSELPWRPVLFGLGAAVGFAVVLGRSRTVQAPGLVPAAPTEGVQGIPGRVEQAIGRSIHLPSPLKDTIEAELSTDGPVLFSPLDAIDPIGTDAAEQGLEADTAAVDAPADDSGNDTPGVA